MTLPNPYKKATVPPTLRIILTCFFYPKYFDLVKNAVVLIIIFLYDISHVQLNKILCFRWMYTEHKKDQREDAKLAEEKEKANGVEMVKKAGIDNKAFQTSTESKNISSTAYNVLQKPPRDSRIVNNMVIGSGVDNVNFQLDEAASKDEKTKF